MGGQERFRLQHGVPCPEALTLPDKLRIEIGDGIPYEFTLVSDYDDNPANTSRA
jgi:hypothetical protein